MMIKLQTVVLTLREMLKIVVAYETLMTMHVNTFMYYIHAGNRDKTQKIKERSKIWRRDVPLIRK